MWNRIVDQTTSLTWSTIRIHFLTLLLPGGKKERDSYLPRPARTEIFLLPSSLPTSRVPKGTRPRLSPRPSYLSQIGLVISSYSLLL
jgi:hypothetical protein